MGFNTGNGGSLTVGAVVLAIKQWTTNTGARLTENTHSGTNGFSNYEAVVIDARWTAEGPLDEDNLPDVDAGLTPGLKVVATFKNGADARTQVLTATSVEDFEVIDDNTSDIVRWRATGKGGAVTRMST